MVRETERHQGRFDQTVLMESPSFGEFIAHDRRFDVNGWPGSLNRRQLRQGFRLQLLHGFRGPVLCTTGEPQAAAARKRKRPLRCSGVARLVFNAGRFKLSEEGWKPLEREILEPGVVRWWE